MDESTLLYSFLFKTNPHLKVLYALLPNINKQTRHLLAVVLKFRLTHHTFSQQSAFIVSAVSKLSHQSGLIDSAVSNLYLTGQDLFFSPINSHYLNDQLSLSQRSARIISPFIMHCITIHHALYHRPAGIAIPGITGCTQATCFPRTSPVILSVLSAEEVILTRTYNSFPVNL